MTMDLFAALQQKKQQAFAAFQANDLETAGRLLDTVCRTAPGDLQAWLLRAAVYGQGRQFERTIECCNQVLALEPDNSQGHFYLGGAYGSLGRYQEAVSAYRQAVVLSPGDPVIRCGFGVALSFAGQPEEAVAQFQEAIRVRPRYGEALCGLAHAFALLGRYNDAKLHYQRAIVVDPQLREPYVKLGDLLNTTGMPEEAEACYRQGLERHPKARELYHGLANSLRYQGRLAEALDTYRRARDVQADDPAILSGEADIHERLRDYDAAYQRVLSLIDRRALDANGADVYLRICRRYECCDEAIALAEVLLVGGSLNAVMRRTLCHSLGRLLDRQGAYDDAFARVAEANRLLNVSFDAEEHAQRVDNLIVAFSRDALANMPRASIISERPVFIVGMPRSGTTLVEQILASHPEVFGAGELNDVTALVRSLPVTLYPQCMEAIEQERVDGMAQKYLDHLARLAPDARRVTDKMPGNFFHLGLVAVLFPHARVIHCVRDPRDTSLSIFFQPFNVSHAYAADLAHIGAYYREYRRLMAHWKAVLDIPILDVRYADLVAEPERVSRAMVEFVGLPWNERCLQFHDTKRAVATASYDQVRRPVYTSSLGRWRHYEKHLGPLIVALGDVLAEDG
jgi:tetratricopeptide (TPR) repeat protein